MKFYLCETPDGPRYARTRADAKTLDPRFEIVNYDTDQAALVERFNSLMALPATITMGDTHAHEAAVAEEAAPEPEEAPHRPKKGAPVTSATDWGLAPPAGSCPRCEAISAGARHVEGIMAVTNVTYSIDYFSDKQLGLVEEAIADRRRELAAEKGEKR